MHGTPLPALRRALLQALALAAVLAAPFAARAQTITTSVATFGATECNDANSNITINWDFGSTFIPGTAVTVFLTTDATCATTANGAPALSPNQTQTGSLSVRTSAFLFTQTPPDCSAKVSSASPVTISVCAKAGTLTPLVTPVTFALLPPTPPIDLATTEGDQHIRLSWAQGASAENIATYDVFAAAQADVVPDLDAGVTADGGVDGGATSGSSGDQDFAGATPIITRIAATNVDVQSINGQALQNEVPYVFAVRAIDKYGNTSTLSDVATGTPKAVDDFYTHYRNEGGTAKGGGGCSSAGPATWALLGLGAFLFWLARRRKGAPLLLLALAALGPGAARAQQGEGMPILKPDERPSRILLFAVKIDRYSPQIDSEAALVANGARPYFDIFRGRSPLRWQLEVDWQIAHPFGSILLGGTAGYWQNIGKGLDHLTQLPSSDNALLDVVPLGAVLTYRFDWAADRHNIPVIPYAQIGLQAALWASFNGRGDVVQTPDGGRGSGWTTGYTAALGVALSLDFLDPTLAREAYNEVRLQRTSLFAEYGWTELSSFGKSGAMILSDRAWRFGLALEF
jgi:hypothetical protein